MTLEKKTNGANELYTCTSNETRAGGDHENVLQWSWGGSAAKEVDRWNAPASDGRSINISFQYDTMPLPDGWYRDSGQTFGLKNTDGYAMKVDTTSYCQHMLTLEECQQLGAALSYANVLDGDSLGENKGFSGSGDAGRDRPPGCYLFTALQTFDPDKPNLMYNTYTPPEGKMNWYQRCSEGFPCICKAPPNGHFQPDNYDSARGAGLRFGWNCDASAGLTKARGVLPPLYTTDNTYLYMGDACSSDPIHSFGGAMRSSIGDNSHYKTWELELPDGNGEYEITFQARGFSYGCIIENWRASNSKWRFLPVTVRRSVRVGRLTLTGHGRACAEINWIRVKRVARTNLKLAPSRFPSSSNIVWEREIKDGSVKVGDVIVGGHPFLIKYLGGKAQ